MSNLFSEFETVSKQKWLNKIESDAKGISIEDFDWKINEEISISPFAHRDDLTQNLDSFSRNIESNNWSIGQEIIIDDVLLSNKEIVTALENGVSALFIVIGKELSQQEFNHLFNNVNFTYITTYFVVEDLGLVEFLLKSKIEFCKEHGQQLSEVKGGVICHDVLKDNSHSISEAFGSTLPAYSFASAKMDDLFSYKETVVHEVSSLILDVIKILKTDQQESTITLNINIGKSYLLNISKIRAMHLLVSNILNAYGSTPSILTNAKLSDSSISKNENHNLIQFTSQAMSAVIGGVDCLQLPASDIKSNNGSSDFRKRLSRNIQSIMQMESFMNKIVDPAAGSYYIERLTDKIAEQSWVYIQNNS